MNALPWLRSAALSALAASVVVACSGNTAGSSSGVGIVSRTEAQYCADRESRVTTCAADSGTSVVFDRSGCGRDYRCRTVLLAAPDAYLSCRTNPDCGARTSDDSCLGEAGRGRSTAEADRCAKRYAECKASGGKGFDDDSCPVFPAIEPSALVKLTACLDKPCEQIEDCLEATVKALHPDCN